MNRTFKDVQIGQKFTAKNTRQIIFNRGDKRDSRNDYGDAIFVKRDEFGANITFLNGHYSVYYWIEPDEPVEYCRY